MKAVDKENCPKNKSPGPEYVRVLLVQSNIFQKLCCGPTMFANTDVNKQTNGLASNTLSLQNFSDIDLLILGYLKIERFSQMKLIKYLLH